MLTGLVGTSGGAAILGFVLVFGFVWFLGRMVARKMGDSVKGSLLGPVDRVLGLGFGALKGLLIATVAFVGFAMAYDTAYGEDAVRPDWMRQSRTYPLLNASGRAMSQWLAERRAAGGLMGMAEDVTGADDRDGNGNGDGDGDGDAQ
jgi:membrane protein required for colicin V production